ncbi:MAG: universal stress protein [Acidobacteriaceae bacterium]|nr:universal stress protein [Acidobacteriaceae bacterium]
MKFDHILFPIDFSERSRALNQQVEWLAARFGSRVTLLHVFEIPAAWYGACEASFVNMDCCDGLRASAEQRLKEYAIRIPEVCVERILCGGDAAAQIVNWAGGHAVDLIVMGTHGYGAFQGWILGSVTAKVLHRAVCPIWTDSLSHAQPSDPAITKILCAVEMTEEAIPLLRFTKQLAEEFGTTVRLIHSVPELETRPNRYFDFDLHRYLMESARVEITRMQRQAGTEFPLTISETGISKALAEAANEYGANLVVIGRGRAQKTFGRFQTHAHEVIQYAPCPVLSYSSTPQDRISSSCTAEHLSQSAGDERLLTDSRKL